jgi:hypothetical protein
MNLPAKIRFELVNGVSEKDVKNNRYVIDIIGNYFSYPKS